MANNNLFFRRQFLITEKLCPSLNHWNHQLLGKYTIYAHPDVELSTAESENRDLQIALIGFIIDPYHPNRSNREILAGVSAFPFSIDRIADLLYNLGGRFVLIINRQEDTYIFHDPCGLRSVYYTKFNGHITVGSQPLILEKVYPIKKEDVFHNYKTSKYVENNIEHWIPSGQSVFDDINHLVPNHYLQFSSYTQKRYWPRKKLFIKSLDEVVLSASALLEKLLLAGNNRFKMALPLTAGLDSRTILAGSKNIASDIYFFTLQYRNLNLKSNDIRIPHEILKSLDFTHHVINCTGEIDSDFRETYERNVSMSHLNDWGKIAYGMHKYFPEDRVTLKGNCSEISRCFYYHSGKHQPINSLDDIIGLEPGWKNSGFIKEGLEGWFDEAIIVEENTDIDILDLFYWEHRMGSWQAQSQLEWDIVQEAFTPFNHRGLLENMLEVSSEFRCAPKYLLYDGICNTLWPEIMNYPINPPETLKDVAKSFFLRVGLEGKIRKLYNYIITKS